jgi:hypothetical protein
MYIDIRPKEITLLFSLGFLSCLLSIFLSVEQDSVGNPSHLDNYYYCYVFLFTFCYYFLFFLDISTCHHLLHQTQERKESNVRMRSMMRFWRKFVEIYN